MPDKSPYSAAFGDMGGHVWINAAHQGVFPEPAVAAAEKAIHWKRHPYHLTSDAFETVPERMRESLARLLSVPANQVSLANSASYGIHVIAHCFPWRSGDEILIVERDFPTNLLPWTLIEERGVTVRRLEPAGGAPEADEAAQAITPATRLLCTSWVFSLTGAIADLEAIGGVCRDHDVALVVNASQGIGGLPLAPGALPVDAVVGVGFKWLCGPYGTGLLWMRPEFRSRLKPFKAYWLSLMSESDLAEGKAEPDGDPALASRAYDVFEPASFFNMMPWRAAVDYLLDIGIDTIAEHDRGLVRHFLTRLDQDRFTLLSPTEDAHMSHLVYFSHRDPARNAAIVAGLAEQDIHIAARADALRMAPHLYNGLDHVDRLIEAMTQLAK